MYIKDIPEYDGAGIYMLKGINNNLRYIGSSTNIHKRLLEHQYAMATKGGSSNKMKSMIKPDYQFEVIILEKIDGNHTRYYLYNRENYYVNKFNVCSTNGLNTIPVSGYKNSESAILHDLECLTSSINDLNKKMKNTIYNEKYIERLILSNDKCIRNILENMLKKMQCIKHN